LEQLWTPRATPHRANGCRDKDMQADKLGKRIPGQAEGPLVAAASNDEGFARPCIHLCHKHRKTRFAQHLFREVVATDTRPAGNKIKIILPIHRSAQFLCILPHPALVQLEMICCGPRGDKRGVGIANLPRFRSLRWFHDFVARGDVSRQQPSRHERLHTTHARQER
jgi:hypothetical protein